MAWRTNKMALFTIRSQNPLYHIRDTTLGRSLFRVQKSPAFVGLSDNYATCVAPITVDSMRDGKHILLFGLPKTGNYWFNNLIVESLGLEFKTQVQFTHSKFRDKHRYNTNILRSACIIRDIRDMVVSLWHWLPKGPAAKDSRAPLLRTMEQFYFQWFLPIYSQHRRWGDWIEYPKTLVRTGIPIVRYEDLHDDTFGEITRVLKWWKIEYSEQAVQDAIEKNTLQNVKKNAGTVGTYPKGHVRKGGYGGYKEVLPQVILDDINIRFKAYIDDWGYAYY